MRFGLKLYRFAFLPFHFIKFLNYILYSILSVYRSREEGHPGRAKASGVEICWVFDGLDYKTTK